MSFSDRSAVRRESRWRDSSAGADPARVGNSQGLEQPRRGIGAASSTAFFSEGQRLQIG
jgi:hypothetical protein